MIAENELPVYILAQVLKSGDPLLITETIEKMENKSVSLEVLDKWNIPFLVDFHAESVPAAQSLVQRIRQWKNEAFEKQKPAILEDFRTGTIEELDGMEAPNHVILLLTSLMHFNDVDFVKCAFRLLNDLEVSVNDYLENNVYERALQFRNRMIEADVLIAKIDKLMLDEDDEVDEDLEVFDEDVNNELQEEFNQNEENEEIPELNDSFMSDEDVNDDFQDEFNDSFRSDDSGVDFESDQDVQEQEAEEQEAIQRYQDYCDALLEVLCKSLAEVLKGGHHDSITGAIRLFADPSWPLYIFRKYEIQTLIHNYAMHNDLAVELFDKINELEDMELGDEKMDGFRKICETAQRFSEMDEVPEPLMTILMGFLKSGYPAFTHHTATTLLKLRIPLEQFQFHEVKEFLLEYQGKNEDMIHLILNIREMEYAAGLF